MGQVGKFLNEVCASHPQLMAAVLERPFSRLSEWIDWDAEGGPCGCLIGTAALAAGIAESENERDPSLLLAETIGRDANEIEDVGLRVFEMSVRLAYGPTRDLPLRTIGTHESDARVVHMIRQRIARELVIRESNALGAVEMLV